MFFFEKKNQKTFLLKIGALWAGLALWPGVGLAATPVLQSAQIGGGKTMPYFVSATTDKTAITHALVALHGYTRDATRTFDAAQNAAVAAGVAAHTLVVAPVFQVSAQEAERCNFRGTPAAGPTDALWRCGDWSDGGVGSNAAMTSFDAMDMLLHDLAREYPALQLMTVAGFSAGAQFTQHYAAFANPPLPIRYVVADPSEFVYFDPTQPRQTATACPGFDDWKYGTHNLPSFGRSAADARAAYIAADITYLEGSRDTGDGRGTAYRLLERNCAAERQGKFRLDRGENYAAYDAAMLAHGRHALHIVAGCAHSVTCSFASPTAQAALFQAQAED